MSKSNLSGPALDPLNQKPPKNLVIILHGYGADGDNLISLAYEWQDMLPDTMFVAPNAPHPCPETGGYKWFEVFNIDPEIRTRQMHECLPTVHSFIDAVTTHYKVPHERTALVGFSQGGCLTLHSMLERPQKLAAAVSYSGFILDPEYALNNQSYTPTLLVHGQEDTVVPPEASQQAYEILKSLGPVELNIRPNLEHAIDEEGSRLGRDFLKNAFDKSSMDGTESEKCRKCGEIHHG